MTGPGTGFECRRCGECCRQPGPVRVSTAEVDHIAAFLGLDPRAFVEEYARLLPDRTGLSLNETADHACVFLEGSLCRIHAVKPAQCRGFPATWNFDGWQKICRGAGG